MGTYSKSGQLRARWRDRLADGLRALGPFLRAARQGFFNTWPIGLAGLALLAVATARGDGPATGRGKNVGPRSAEPAATGLAEPKRRVLELAVIAGLALLVAHIARAKRSRGWPGPRLQSGGAGIVPSSADDPRHSSPTPLLDPRQFCTHMTHRGDGIMSAHTSDDPPPATPRGRRIGRGLMTLAALAILGGRPPRRRTSSTTGPSPR